MDGKEKIISAVIRNRRSFYTNYIATGDESVSVWNSLVLRDREIIAAALLPNIHPTPCDRRCKGTSNSTDCTWSCKACGGAGKVRDQLCPPTVSCPTCVPARMMQEYFSVIGQDLPTENRTQDRLSVVMPPKGPVTPAIQVLPSIVMPAGEIVTARAMDGRQRWEVLIYPMRSGDHAAAVYSLREVGDVQPTMPRIHSLIGWTQSTPRALPAELIPAYERLRANNWRIPAPDYQELLP